MAKRRIEIDDEFLERWEPIAFRCGLPGELIVLDDGDVQATEVGTDYPRLIVLPKQKQARQYNADEMQQLHRDRVQLKIGNIEFTVDGFSELDVAVRVGGDWYGAEKLRRVCAHLDGRRCEVAE